MLLTRQLGGRSRFIWVGVSAGHQGIYSRQSDEHANWRTLLKTDLLPKKWTELSFLVHQNTQGSDETIQM